MMYIIGFKIVLRQLILIYLNAATYYRKFFKYFTKLYIFIRKLIPKLIVVAQSKNVFRYIVTKHKIKI